MFSKYYIISLCFLSINVVALPYQIQTEPTGARVYNILTKQHLGITPITVEVADDEVGSTFGLTFERYENVAVRIVDVPMNADNNYQYSPPAVATLAFPGKAPLDVKVDDNKGLVTILMKPIMSVPVH